MIIMSSIAFGQENNKTVKDIDGNVYKTVTIGSQVWMAENLKTIKYNDGTAIPNVIDGASWWGSRTIGAYCDYDNTSSNSSIYGRLYNWYTVNTGKLCPKGLSVPTDAEWTILITYLGGESIAGSKHKEAGSSHWISPNQGASNSSGFSALPGGTIEFDGKFYGIGGIGVWWSSTESSTDYAWHRSMSYSSSVVSRDFSHKAYGFSVRCVKD